ncbi:MAG: hypothetical protein LUC18_00400, partial [Porphyromonadaceae bacterium]|nr:hypothetical protein [Porphyromonadaceae bacterium]
MNNYSITVMKFKGTLVMCLLLFMIYTFDINEFHYVHYLCLVLISVMTFTKLELKSEITYVNALLVIILTSFLRVNQWTILMAKDLGLMLVGILPFLCNANFKFNISIFNKFLWILFVIAAGSRLFSLNFSINAFLSSNTGIELGSFAYTFAFLAVYWVGKSSRNVYLNILFSVIAGKRIVTLSILVCVLIAFFCKGKETKYVNKYIKIGLFALVVVYIVLSYMFAYGLFDSFILSTFDRSANQLTMGRQRLFLATFSHISIPEFWGIGAGNSIDIIHAATNDMRMHNDFLKIYAENGLFVFIAFFYVLFRKLRYSQLPYITTMFALFMTTNTMIYAIEIFLFGLFFNADKYFYYRNSKKTVPLVST